METDSFPTAETKHHKLRWYQWRLRTLFLLTLLVAIGMSWLTVTMRDQWKQKAAAEAIEKAQEHVQIQSEPTWLGKLLRDDSLVRVTGVNLDGWPIGDDVLVHLQELSQLQVLELRNSGVTDAGLAYLQGLSQLHTLGLIATNVTDAGLVHLQGLSQLQNWGSITPKSPTPDWCICKG